MSMHGLLHASYELIKLHEAVNVTDQNLVFTTCLICFIIFSPKLQGEMMQRQFLVCIRSLLSRDALFVQASIERKSQLRYIYMQTT